MPLRWLVFRLRRSLVQTLPVLSRMAPKSASAAAAARASTRVTAHPAKYEPEPIVPLKKKGKRAVRNTHRSADEI